VFRGLIVNVNLSIICSIVLFKHSKSELMPTLLCLINSVFIKHIVLVDNDESDWASAFIHEKIIYWKSEGNFGFGYGHNFAIKKYASECNFYLICNPDIKFDFQTFENLAQFASTRSEGLFLPKIVYPNGENQFGARLLPSPLNLFARRFSKSVAVKLDKKYLLQDFKIEKPVFVPYLSGCFMLFRSEALLALNGFDERYFMYMEDIDLSRRCAEKFGALYCPQFKLIHTHEQASYKNKELLKAHLRSAVQYFNKWGWIYDSKRKILNDKCIQSINMQ